MAALVHTGTQASCASAVSLTINSPSAAAGNKLVLEVSWVDTGSTTPVTPTAPTGWSSALAVASAASTGGCVGYSVFYKTAAGGIEHPVFSAPTGGFSLFADGIITEWSGMGSHDAADSSALTTNNAAASTTGVTVPNTGTLANPASTIFTGASLLAASGLANAAIAFSGGSWTTEMSDQDTASSVGTLSGHKVVASSSPLGAVYIWTADASLYAYQAAVVVFSDQAISSDATDTSSATGALTTGVRPSAAAADTTSATGALSTGIKAAAAATDTSSATGSIGGPTFGSAATDSTSATGALSTAIQAAGAAADVSTASGTFTSFASVVLAAPLYTGIGGILDPHFWAGGSAPGIGSTVLYDPTHISIATNSEISSDVNDCRAVVQFFDGTTWRVGLVIITPGMVAYADVATAITDALTTGIPLISAATNLALVTDSLTAQIKLASAAADVSTASGLLSTTIPLLSAAADTTSALGTLPGGSAPIAATATDTTAATAALSTLIQLTEAATTSVTAAASLLTAIQLAVSAVSTTTATGALGGNQATLVGSASDSSTSIGALSTQIQAASAATDLAIAAGALATKINLVSAAVDPSQGSGSLATQVATALQTLSSATADLTTQIKFRGAAIASSIVSAALSSQINLASDAADTSSSIANLAPIPRFHFGWAVVTALSQTVQGARQAFIEQSACEIMTAFFDTAGDTYTPVGLRYRIDDVVSGSNILPWTALQPAISELINVSSPQNALISLSRPHEAHQVMIEITDDFGSISYARVEFDLYRVAGLA